MPDYAALRAISAAFVPPRANEFDIRPLLTRPDPSREKSLASRSSSRLTAHTSHNSY